MKATKRILKTTLFAFILAGLTTISTQAQDATEVDPDHYSVIFENDHVRVIRITYGPNETSVMHSHGAGVVIFLEDNEGQFELPDGSVVEFSATAGDVQWSEAGQHLPTAGNTGASVILVEVKSDHEGEHE